MSETVRKKVFIWDETLRGGEQTPGVVFSVKDKMEIAGALDDAGVSVIDAGFPIMSAGEQEAIKSILGMGLKAEVGVTVRHLKTDIDAALSLDVKNIYLFHTTSDIHLKHKDGVSREEAKRRTMDGIDYAVEHGLNVTFISEDTMRSDLSFVEDMVSSAIEHGAERVILCDTSSVAAPEHIKEVFERFTSKFKVPFGVHCHNDFGMAVANTVSAVAGGAVYPTLAVNSLGDGSGNAALEEVVMALEKIYGMDTGMDTTKLYEISKLVEERSGCYLAPQKPISGLNSYRHESEVHVSGVLKYPEVYEPIKPEEVGREREFVIGKHSGPSIIKLKLSEKDMEADEGQTAEILRRIKAEKEGMSKEPIKKMLDELDRYGKEVLGFPEERFWEIVEEVLGDRGDSERA